jgi:hypothetical protein
MILLVAGSLAFLFPAVHAAYSDEREILYRTDFSMNHDWQTNSPSRYYWDQANGRYRYRIEPSTGSYSFVSVDYKDTAFTLEYDVTPMKTGPDTAFRLGIGGKEMDFTKGPCVISYFTDDKNGNLMGLRVITRSNHMLEVTSYAYSYGGINGKFPTVRYADGQTYHVIVQYSLPEQMVSMTVSNKADGTQLWSYFVKPDEDLHGMSRLYITSIGDYGGGTNYAEGYLDNVVLSVPEPAVQDARTAATTQPATSPATKITTKPPATPATQPPGTPGPTRSPAPSLTAIGALGVAALAPAALIARKRI